MAEREEERAGARPDNAIPRWLVIGFAVKLAVIALIVAVIVWYANR